MAPPMPLFTMIVIYDNGHAKALQFNALIQDAIKAGRLNLEWATPAIHKEAWDIFKIMQTRIFLLWIVQVL